MKVSIIITSYNSEKYIERAINSVLKQTYRDKEIIVIDDNSKDGTIRIINKYKKFLKIVQKKSNKGPANSRNIGVRLSNGDLICFLDADDYWKEKKIEKQILYAKKFKDIKIFANNVFSIRNNSTLLKRFDKKKVFNSSKKKSGIVSNYLRISGRYSFHPPSIIMVRKKLFYEKGFFNEKLKAVEDSELVLRWVLKGEKLYFNDEALGFYELSNNQSLTKNLNKWCKNHFRYWFDKDIQKLGKKRGKIFFLMRKNTLLSSIFIVIKRGNLNLARFYLLKYKKDLFSFKWLTLLVLSCLPITLFFKFKNYAK